MADWRWIREALLADGGTETMEAARALIDRVEVHPPAEPGGKPRLELLGELSMMRNHPPSPTAF